MNIAIIGAAYTGYFAAQYLKAKGHTVSTTTTQERRVADLEAVSDRVVVMKGSDTDKMRELIAGQDIVLMTVAGGMVERDVDTIGSRGRRRRNDRLASVKNRDDLKAGAEEGEHHPGDGLSS